MRIHPANRLLPHVLIPPLPWGPVRGRFQPNATQVRTARAAQNVTQGSANKRAGGRTTRATGQGKTTAASASTRPTRTRESVRGRPRAPTAKGAPRMSSSNPAYQAHRNQAAAAGMARRRAQINADPVLWDLYRAKHRTEMAAYRARKRGYMKYSIVKKLITHTYLRSTATRSASSKRTGRKARKDDADEEEEEETDGRVSWR